MRPSYDNRPTPAGGFTRTLLRPVKWLVGLHPLQSWLIVMAIIIGLTWVGLRPLAMLVALAWLGFAVLTWVSPRLRRNLARWR